MNYEECLVELSKLLHSFQCHPRFLNELLALIAKTGAEKSILSILLTRLRNLHSLGIGVTRVKEFEPLGNGVFSMHLSGKGYNIRILFMFFSDKTPALLHAFYERAGKKATDYTDKIRLARARFAEFKEE